jgi:hypothetical protein
MSRQPEKSGQTTRTYGLDLSPHSDTHSGRLSWFRPKARLGESSA